MVVPHPEPVSASLVEAPVEIVAPESVSASPAELVEAPPAIEPSGEPAWLRPAEEAKAPVEVVEPPPEPAGVSAVEPVEVPVEPVAPEPEPVSASPVEAPVEIVAPEPVSASPAELVEAPPAIEPSGEPAWLQPAEEAKAPVEMVEPPSEPAAASPVEPAEAPAAVEPRVVRLSLINRARALASALAEMVGPRAEPASPRPVEPAEAPAAKVEAQPAPVSPPPVERAEPPTVIEPRGEPAWLPPAEEAHAPVEPVEPSPEPASVSPAEPAEAPAEMVEEALAPVEPVEPPPEPASVSPREQAEALVSRGDLEGAWKVYYDALRVEPDDLRLWYGLGRTLSRLNRPKETEEIFQYVVSRGDADSEEVKYARKWLAGAELLAEPAAPAVPAAPRSGTDPWATVWGKVTWGEPEPPREAFLVIQGLDKDAPRSHARVQFGQLYEFKRLPPGEYHLIGGAENEWLWDLRFAVEAGQELILDLTRNNSTNPRARV
jgi:hypothetical protein